MKPAPARPPCPRRIRRSDHRINGPSLDVDASACGAVGEEAPTSKPSAMASAASQPPQRLPRAGGMWQVWPRRQDGLCRLVGVLPARLCRGRARSGHDLAGQRRPVGLSTGAFAPCIAVVAPCPRRSGPARIFAFDQAPPVRHPHPWLVVERTRVGREPSLRRLASHGRNFLRPGGS